MWTCMVQLTDRQVFVLFVAILMIVTAVGVWLVSGDLEHCLQCGTIDHM